MSKKIIVANWKMNPANEKEAKKLFDSVKKGIKSVKNVEVVICPPFVYLSLFKGLILGAQDVSHKEKGAYTGEVSAQMLKDLKVKHVIIGHSEVRNLGETDEIINKKLKLSLEVGLHPILCVGEKEGEEKSQVLDQQIRGGLANISLKDIKKIIFAYEPVWAIGTGKNCSVEETISSILLIKSIISRLYSRDVADAITFIYGGSIDSKNAAMYLKESVIGGVLVGGASLKAQEFIDICKI